VIAATATPWGGAQPPGFAWWHPGWAGCDCGDCSHGYAVRWSTTTRLRMVAPGVGGAWLWELGPRLRREVMHHQQAYLTA